MGCRDPPGGEGRGGEGRERIGVEGFAGEGGTLVGGLEAWGGQWQKSGTEWQKLAARGGRAAAAERGEGEKRREEKDTTEQGDRDRTSRLSEGAISSQRDTGRTVGQDRKKHGKSGDLDRKRRYSTQHRAASSSIWE